MTEQDYQKLTAEIESLRRENERLKCDNIERIKCEAISSAAMKEALKQEYPSAEIDSFLSSIGKSLKVDRIYVFEDDPDGDGVNNTYEWCNENVAPEIGNMQNVPFEAVEWWYKHFERGEDIHIQDLESIRETEPVTYRYLKPQGIRSLIAKRLMLDDCIIGFFGVDNPRVELMADTSSFLDILSNFLSSLIQNRDIYLTNEARYVSELEEKNAALNEALSRAKGANAAKSLFFSSMSHDIRTPLNAILGMTSIARDHIDDKKRVEDCLQKITVSGTHLLELINDVLDMAKIESGKMNFHMEDLSLNEALDSVGSITQIHSKERAQKYITNVHDIISDRVICDSLRLNQILLNLLSNAIKYTPDEGEIRVDLWQEESPQGPDYVLTHINVSDTGIGMTPEFLETIFDSFTRDDVSQVHQTQGTGLGMNITRNIIDALGGTIDVSSEPGKGSTFRITLDLKKGEEKGGEADRMQQDTEVISLEGMRILLAEDNDINAEIAMMILEENGASVTRCEDGLLAVKRFEESETGYYHAILMDLRMPNMDGLEAARAIRLLPRVDGKMVPIIAMTADAFSDDVQKCINAGMNAHVPKPIDVDMLKRTLVKYGRV